MNWNKPFNKGKNCFLFYQWFGGFPNKQQFLVSLTEGASCVLPTSEQCCYRTPELKNRYGSCLSYPWKCGSSSSSCLAPCVASHSIISQGTLILIIRLAGIVLFETEVRSLCLQTHTLTNVRSTPAVWNTLKHGSTTQLARIAQSVLWLATGWTIRVSNLGGGGGFPTPV